MVNAQITMKRSLSFFLFAFLLLPGNLRAQSGWTVDDCMRYAVEQNYRVRNSRLDTRIAGEDLTAAYGDFLPSVSATGALGKRLGRSVDPKTNLYTSSSFLESTMGLNVSLPVFDGFTRVNRLQFRKLNRRIGALTEQIEENRIAFEVMDAFFHLCFDEKMYQLAVEQRKLSERYHEQMLEYVDLGMRSPSDLQEVKARLQSDIYQETVKANGCRLSLLALKELLNMRDTDRWRSLLAGRANFPYFLSWNPTRSMPIPKRPCRNSGYGLEGESLPQVTGDSVRRFFSFHQGGIKPLFRLLRHGTE